MVNAIYFHGIHGNTQKSIAPFLEKELNKFNINLLHPKFFKDGDAEYENFKKVANTLAQKNLINENTIIIAHSIGNSFAIKFLQEMNLKPFAYISLAGYCKMFPLNNEKTKMQIKNALPSKKQLDYVSKNIKTRISLYSNDHLISEEILKDFSTQINSKLYYVENKGHFGRKLGIQELPELIEILKENKLV